MEKPRLNLPLLVGGVLLILLTVGIFVFNLLNGIKKMKTSMKRMKVPGQATFQLKPGTYTIFHEWKGTVDGEFLTSRDMPDARILVTPEDGGDKIPVKPAGMNSTYTVGNSAGYAIAKFNIDNPGKYRVKVAYKEGKTEPETILTFSSGFMKTLLGTIFGGIAIMMTGIIAGIAMIAFTLVKYFTESNKYRKVQAQG